MSAIPARKEIRLYRGLKESLRDGPYVGRIVHPLRGIYAMYCPRCDRIKTMKQLKTGEMKYHKCPHHKS